MSEPKWLSRREVERLHTKVIDIAGGSHGLRDAGLLESALARPQNLFSYGEDDVFQLAASYAEGIARNHAFVDGNKRTAFQSAHFFLARNGQALQPAKGDEHANMMESFAQGHMSREQVATHLAKYSIAVE